MKRIIAMFLALICVLSYGTATLAAESKNSIDSDNWNLYQQMNEIASAKGITLLPYEEIFSNNSCENSSSIDSEISYDYPGKNIIEQKKPMTTITPLPTIQPNGGNTQNDAREIIVGTTAHATILTAGETDWFTFRVNGNGAHNLYSIGSVDTRVEFYKRTWYGSYSLIDTNDDGGDNLNFRLELGLEMGVDYYVKVTSFNNDTGTYGVMIEENVDSEYSPTGGSWTWNVATPDPDGLYTTVHKIVYLPANEATAYYVLLSENEILENRNYILSLPYNLAVAYLLTLINYDDVVLELIIGLLPNFILPDLTEIELNALVNAGGGINSNGAFNNGVAIISMSTYDINLTPFFMNTYESWDSYYMSGYARYRGIFDQTDKTPCWSL